MYDHYKLFSLILNIHLTIQQISNQQFNTQMYMEQHVHLLHLT